MTDAWLSRNLLSDEWGRWHAVQFPSLIGGCFVSALSCRAMVSPWHLPQTLIIPPFINLFSTDAWGLWQLTHPCLLIMGQCIRFLPNASLIMLLWHPLQSSYPGFFVAKGVG